MLTLHVILLLAAALLAALAAINVRIGTLNLAAAALCLLCLALLI